MTPFGARLRALRAERGVALKDLGEPVGHGEGLERKTEARLCWVFTDTLSKIARSLRTGSKTSDADTGDVGAKTTAQPFRLHHLINGSRGAVEIHALERLRSG